MNLALTCLSLNATFPHKTRQLKFLMIKMILLFYSPIPAIPSHCHDFLSMSFHRGWKHDSVIKRASEGSNKFYLPNNHPSTQPLLLHCTISVAIKSISLITLCQCSFMLLSNISIITLIVYSKMSMSIILISKNLWLFVVV